MLMAMLAVRRSHRCDACVFEGRGNARGGYRERSVNDVLIVVDLKFPSIERHPCV
jgi:hypothetical protein